MDTKGHGFEAVLLWNRVQTLIILVWNRVRFVHSGLARSLEEEAFIIVSWEKRFNKLREFEALLERLRKTTSGGSWIGSGLKWSINADFTSGLK